MYVGDDFDQFKGQDLMGKSQRSSGNSESIYKAEEKQQKRSIRVT